MAMDKPREFFRSAFSFSVRTAILIDSRVGGRVEKGEGEEVEVKSLLESRFWFAFSALCSVAPACLRFSILCA